MKKMNLLENFEYTIFDFNVIGNRGSASGGKPPASLLQIKIDFAEGELSIHADSQFISQHSLYEQRSRQFVRGNQVNMEMDILPASVFDLNDIRGSSQVFHLRGSLAYGSALRLCEGLLTVKNKKPGELWELAFHIYDDSIEFGEIKFELPLIHDSNCLSN